MSNANKPTSQRSGDYVLSESYDTATNTVRLYSPPDNFVGMQVNKFGYTVKGVQTTATDIWDRSDATPTQQVWLAPTAARIHAVVSGSASDSCGTGTLTLTENAADTNTVTIGAKVYTFQTVLTDVDGNVLIGASASASIDNLVAAVNLAAGAGTTYATTTTSIDGKAFIGAGDTMSYYDHTSGAVATTDTLAGASAWGATTITAGVGARSLRIYGLKTWATEETSEDIYFYGVDTQNTVNSYVIIHRMKCLTWGTTSPNVGAITAAAASDSTITAQINATNGQTLMAIYGIPSTQTAYMTRHYGDILKASGGAGSISFSLLVNPIPDSITTGFLVKNIRGVQSTGNSTGNFPSLPYRQIAGPAIIKISGIASAADVEGSAGFDLILVDNQGQ